MTDEQADRRISLALCHVTSGDTFVIPDREIYHVFNLCLLYLHNPTQTSLFFFFEILAQKKFFILEEK